MDVLVIKGNNNPSYSNIMTQMFRQRKKIFIDVLGWDLTATDGLEIDEFDNDDAIYMICVDSNQQVKASLRLLPTNKPYLFQQHFPDLSIKPLPNSPTVYEATRLYSMTAGKGFRRDTPGKTLLKAMIIYGTQENFDHYCCICSLKILEVILHYGLDMEPLGIPKFLDKDLISGFNISLGEQAVARIEKAMPDIGDPFAAYAIKSNKIAAA